jgi:hypothetical protein
VVLQSRPSWFACYFACLWGCECGCFVSDVFLLWSCGLLCWGGGLVGSRGVVVTVFAQFSVN